MRYQVTEVSGYLTINAPRHANEGTSFHVIDTLCNHRVMGTWRSEDYARGGHARVARARLKAEERAAELNETHTPEPPPAVRYLFRPTCPRPSCGTRCDPEAIYCTECGTRLYTLESGKYGLDAAPALGEDADS